MMADFEVDSGTVKFEILNSVEFEADGDFVFERPADNLILPRPFDDALFQRPADDQVFTRGS